MLEAKEYLEDEARALYHANSQDEKIAVRWKFKVI
jgi:hypothetical protein